METSQSMGARVGDMIEIGGRKVGSPGRTGEIVEVLGEPSHRHFRVRWENESETVFYPSNDAVVKPRPSGTRRKRRAAG